MWSCSATNEKRYPPQLVFLSPFEVAANFGAILCVLSCTLISMKHLHSPKSSFMALSCRFSIACMRPSLYQSLLFSALSPGLAGRLSRRTLMLPFIGVALFARTRKSSSWRTSVPYPEEKQILRFCIHIRGIWIFRARFGSEITPK